MARRLWIATIGASLCAGLLPACAHLPWSRSGQGSQAAVSIPGPPTPLPPPDQPVPIPGAVSGSPYHSWQANPPPETATPVSNIRQDSEHAEPEAQEHIMEKEQPRPDGPDLLPNPTAAEGTSTVSSKEPLLDALERFLNDRPEEALGYLQHYDERSQELFLRLLPILAQLTHKNPGQLESGEVAALSEQLQGLMVSLRYRAELGIDTICFCARVKGYGDYKALPPDHVFRPKTDTQPGEGVQLYVELRNFCMEPCADGYEARLRSLVEIHDEEGNCVWQSAFEGERRVLSRTPRHDHCNNYSFYTPSIPPGRYILTLQIRDVTRPDAPREAKKSVEFRVGM